MDRCSQSQVFGRKLIIFNQIVFIDADHSAEAQLVIREAANDSNTCNMLFWVPITIRRHSVLLKSSRETWKDTNVHNLPMLGFQIRISSDLWNTWPSDKTFLIFGNCKKGMTYEDWICFSMKHFAGSSLLPDFHERPCVFLQNKYWIRGRTLSRYETPHVRIRTSFAGFSIESTTAYGFS